MNAAGMRAYRQVTLNWPFSVSTRIPHKLFINSV